MKKLQAAGGKFVLSTGRAWSAINRTGQLGGKEMCGVPILPLSELEAFCTEHHPEVAVLCVPRQSAMDLAGELVGQGIKGFWNFSHYDLSVEYPAVTVENVHLGITR